MAEERLIDDDKDRKYKIRKNEDGEDELVLDPEAAEEEPEEEVSFEVPDLDSDDEEAAVMTPEQLAERERRREEEEKKRKAELKEIAAHARELIAEKKFEDAGYVLAKAEECEDGEIYVLKLRAATKDFTDFSSPEEGEEAVTGVKSYAGGEVLEELSAFVPGLKVKAEDLKKEVEALASENEGKKGERRVLFMQKRNKSAIFFAATVVPLLVFAVLAIYFSTIMYAEKDGSNITLFIVFVSLAGAFFIATVFSARSFWKNADNLKLNERNSSTKLGRKFELSKAGLTLAENILEIFVSDIS